MTTPTKALPEAAWAPPAPHHSSRGSARELELSKRWSSGLRGPPRARQQGPPARRLAQAEPQAGGALVRPSAVIVLHRLPRHAKLAADAPAAQGSTQGERLLTLLREAAQRRPGEDQGSLQADPALSRVRSCWLPTLLGRHLSPVALPSGHPLTRSPGTPTASSSANGRIDRHGQSGFVRLLPSSPGRHSRRAWTTSAGRPARGDLEFWLRARRRSSRFARSRQSRTGDDDQVTEAMAGLPPAPSDRVAEGQAEQVRRDAQVRARPPGRIQAASRPAPESRRR